MAPAPALAVGKLATLGFKVVTKPIANGIKDAAKASPDGRVGRLARSVGQFYHRAGTTIERWLMGRKRSDLQPMDPKWAVARGADLIAELTMGLLLTAYAIHEYNIWGKQAEEEKKEKLRKQAPQKPPAVVSICAVTPCHPLKRQPRVPW